MSLNDPVVLVRYQRRPDRVEDAWGADVEVHPVVDAVVLHRTDETVDRDDGYQIMQDEVWVCAHTGRRFVRSIDGVGGMGHWWRPLEGSATRDQDFKWGEAAQKRMRFVLNGAPCTPEAAEAALRSGGFRPRDDGFYLAVDRSTNSILLVCACGASENLGARPTATRIAQATEAHTASHALPEDG